VNIPCFGALPLACPVLPGDPAFNSLHIRNDLEASSLTIAPMFSRWFTGLQELYQHNHGMSLHASDTLFTWADIDTINFDTLLPLRAAPTVLLEGIGSLEEHYVNLAVIFKGEQMAAYFRFSQNGTPASLHQAAAPPPSPSTNNGGSAADLQQLIQHLRRHPATAPVPTTTSAERECAKESEGATIKHRLLFGRTVEVVDPSDPSSERASI
jgi:hypothetical protein